MSMGFSRQEHWSGLLFPLPGDLPDPEIESQSPALVGRFIYHFLKSIPVCQSIICASISVTYYLCIYLQIKKFTYLSIQLSAVNLSTIYQSTDDLPITYLIYLQSICLSA